MMWISPGAVDCGTTRYRRLLLCLLCAALPVGCTPKGSAPREASTPSLLDNHGGFSHGGRKVALLPDGSYRDTMYTDIPSAASTTRGVYTWNANRTHLTLTPENGAVEHLYRVDYQRRQYWVHENERHRIRDAKETWLRQISLRTGTE